MNNFLTVSVRWGSIVRCALLITSVALTGCANLKPWVKPYERDTLALPYMAFDRHQLADEYMSHAFQSREGARGAEGGSGGGCGCN